MHVYFFKKKDTEKSLEHILECYAYKVEWEDGNSF